MIKLIHGDALKSDVHVICHLTNVDEIIQGHGAGILGDGKHRSVEERCWRLCKKSGKELKGKVYCIYLDGEEKFLALFFAKETKKGGHNEINLNLLKNCFYELQEMMNYKDCVFGFTEPNLQSDESDAETIIEYLRSNCQNQEQ